ncbi:14852_t:CDS:2 [Gigaspora margarita]|uniref:14852_t:CDS:1 n=1 Tax=Gigaspora margarita TaxID=4874 RepID=A0ABM8W676_GIGMA|nr:14852_t:CDS:2 [Gigaspora margarita]
MPTQIFDLQSSEQPIYPPVELTSSSSNIKQEQTTTFYSVSPSSIQLLDPIFAPVSSIISPTLFNITTWDTFHTDNYNTETQYTPIYPTLTNFEKPTQTPINNQSDSDSEQSFGEAFTAILDRVQILNNNTNNQDLSSNYFISNKESNSSDSETEIDNAGIALN